MTEKHILTSLNILLVVITTFCFFASFRSLQAGSRKRQWRVGQRRRERESESLPSISSTEIMAAIDHTDEPERVDYHPPATWASDFQVLKSLYFADVKGETQQERLESFYVSQADLYDSYRHRMLHGRFPMINNMPAPKGGVWVDIGGKSRQGARANY